jgi:hypothetical protein
MVQSTKSMKTSLIEWFLLILACTVYSVDLGWDEWPATTHDPNSHDEEAFSYTEWGLHVLPKFLNPLTFWRGAFRNGINAITNPQLDY